MFMKGLGCSLPEGFSVSLKGAKHQIAGQGNELSMSALNLTQLILECLNTTWSLRRMEIAASVCVTCHNQIT